MMQLIAVVVVFATGNSVGKKGYKISDSITCGKKGGDCYRAGYCAGEYGTIMTDSCCYPMNCGSDGKCYGSSGNRQQCATTDCRKGYNCNRYSKCEPCSSNGKFCNKGQDCCLNENLKCIPIGKDAKNFEKRVKTGRQGG